MGIYYSPENYGLEIVGEIEWSDASYQFDLTVVWRRKLDGQLFYADDSGCSCPSPFEDFKGVNHLTAASMFEVSGHLIETAQLKARYHSFDPEEADVSDEHAMKISELMGRLAIK
jgi:hypothetical protein